MCRSEGRWNREEEEAIGVFGKQRESCREQLHGKRGRGEREVEEREHEKEDRRESYTDMTESEAGKELSKGNCRGFHVTIRRADHKGRGRHTWH